MTTNETLETKETLYTLEDLLEAEEADEIIGHLDSDELKVIEAILELKINGQWDKDKKEYFYTLEDLQEAVDLMDHTTYYYDEDSYFDSMDDLLEFPKEDNIFERYFDYEAYHRDCMFDVSEASNGVILADW